jgi:hypothetical protein
MSISLATGSTLLAYEKTFCKALGGAKGRADAAIRQYRMHKDVGRVAGEVAGEHKRVLVYASYLLGHIDGLEQDAGALSRMVTEALERYSFFKTVFSKLYTELRAMHSTYGRWPGLEVFEPLKQLSAGLLKLGGIDIQNRPDGRHMWMSPLISRRSLASKSNRRF